MVHPSAQNSTQVKQHNRQAILLSLLHAPKSRVELARDLHVSAMTVTNLTGELLQDGWVREEPENAASTDYQRSVGRPAINLAIVPDASFAFGLHIGIGIVRLGLVNLLGQLVHSAQITFPLVSQAEEVIQQIGVLIAESMTAWSLHPEQIMGIGVGASGLVNSEKRVNVLAPRLGWRNVPIGEQLSQLTNFPVLVENNVRAMALAESYFGRHRNASKNADSLVFVYGRTGVGAGITMRGEILRGLSAGAGEIGHTIMIMDGGLLCHCGQRGCLETLVSQPALMALSRQLAAEVTNQKNPAISAIEEYGLSATDPSAIAELDHFLAQLQQGDAKRLAAIHQVATFLGIALANLTNTLNPNLIVVGGMYAQAADYFLPFLREVVAQKSFSDLGRHVHIEATTFGENANVIGAASVALVQLFYQQVSK